MFYISEEINKNLLSEYIYDDEENVSVKNVYEFQKNIGANDIKEFAALDLSLKEMSLCRCCFIFLNDDIYKENIMEQNRENFNLNFLAQNAKEFGFAELPRSFRFENFYSRFFSKGKYENKVVISDKQNKNVLKICEYVSDINQPPEYLAHLALLAKQEFRFEVETSLFSGKIEDCPDEYFEEVFSIATELIKSSRKYFSFMFGHTIAEMLIVPKRLKDLKGKQNSSGCSTEAMPHI